MTSQLRVGAPKPALEGDDMDHVVDDGNRPQPQRSPVGRRELIKIGTGVVSVALGAPRALAQSAPSSSPAVAPPRTEGAMMPPAQAPAIVTRTGYRNTAGRIGGNGPMDAPSRSIVKFVSAFSERDITEPVAHAVGNVMVDSIASLIA